MTRTLKTLLLALTLFGLAACTSKPLLQPEVKLPAEPEYSQVQLQQAIISHHPYEVPEVIAMPVTDGHPAYLRWVATETLSDPAADDHA